MTINIIYTFTKNVIGETQRGLRYVIPDCVADDQHAWNQKAFPALREGTTIRHRVKLRGDLYDIGSNARIMLTRWDR